MIRTSIADLPSHVGETVTIAGWVQTLRLQRAMQFVLVRDHTGTVQLTHRRDGTDLEAELERLTPESAVRVTGKVIANPVVTLGALEIIPDQLTVEARAAIPLPIDDKTGPEGRLDWRFLDVRRRPETRRVFAVQTTVERAMREFAYANGCTEMHTPKLMGTASESGAEVFELGYFGRSAYLAQSPQFYKQMAIAAGIDRVFAVVAKEHGEAIRDLLGVEVTVPDVPFPRITMAQAHEIGGTPGERGDLDPAGERAVAAHLYQRTGHEFVFVTRYPASIRPFYHMRPAGHPDLTLSFDLLWRGLEITTGAQREHRYDVLLSQAAEKGLHPEPIRDYLNCFRYGCPPHGGLGLGLGRLLMVLLGLDSIRDATFLFRGPNRLTP
jgi:aspartyl/asparaginyl-tRNA synthetase